MDKDLTSAKALYQQMQDEGLQVNELSLKRLALLYKNAGETVPFQEPPVNMSLHSTNFPDEVSRVHEQKTNKHSIHMHGQKPRVCIPKLYIY